MKYFFIILSLVAVKSFSFPEHLNNKDVDLLCEGESRKYSSSQGLDFQVVCSLEEFQAIGETQESLNKNYILGKDIDLSAIHDKGQQFKLGTGTYLSSPEKSFQGTFDGNAHLISNFQYESPSEYYVGLFGQTRNAVIKNLRLDSIFVHASTYAGALVGKAIDTTIENITATNVWIRGHRVQGGLVGGYQFDVKLDMGSIVERQNEGTNNYMRSVLVMGHIRGDSLTTGGVVGYNHYPIDDLSSIVKLSGSETSKGYLVGYSIGEYPQTMSYYPLDFNYIYGEKELNFKRSFYQEFFGLGERYHACGNDKVQFPMPCRPEESLMPLSEVKSALEAFPIDLNLEPSFF